MQITFLGTGTSHGVPRIACSCAVCKSQNEKNRRLRSSIILKDNDRNLLIDASIDFRQQALKYGISHISDVLITHIHADHIFGLDDMRVFSSHGQNALNIYLNRKFNKRIKKLFPYIYVKRPKLGGGVTRISNTVLKPYMQYTINGFKVVPLPVKHGEMEIFAYKINNMAYITDASFISEKSVEYIKNIDFLIINALRIRKHSTHFNLDEAIEISQKINAGKTYFTHICHDLDHDSTNRILPGNMELAFDGMTLNI